MLIDTAVRSVGGGGLSGSAGGSGGAIHVKANDIHLTDNRSWMFQEEPMVGAVEEYFWNQQILLPMMPAKILSLKVGMVLRLVRLVPLE